jgi:prepilin-type processing-associated H-X9-DG protein
LNYEGGTGGNTAAAGMQLQTCVNNGSGACSASPTTHGIDDNPSNAPAGTLHNCSDPSGAGTGCAVFPTPTDEFVQVGEYMWSTDTGHVWSFNPLGSTNSIFQPGVTPLVAAYKSGTFEGYYGSHNIKDNTPGKANILYLGGHDQTANVAGTKVALETLLLLGLSTVPIPTTTTETSRSTPITATVSTGTTALITGLFENVQPSPGCTQADDCLVTASADLTNWKFPYVLGHLRAKDVSLITGALNLSDNTGVLFDPGAGSSSDLGWDGAVANSRSTTRAARRTSPAPAARSSPRHRHRRRRQASR